MEVKVLVFGRARELAGSGSIAVHATDGATLADVIALVKTQHPAMAQLSAFSTAINGQYAAIDTLLSAGDEVAIIPPVSGG
ncbi:MAG: MoaD/ThiS family protein [Bacteroidota bacterium]